MKLHDIVAFFALVVVMGAPASAQPTPTRNSDLVKLDRSQRLLLRNDALDLVKIVGSQSTNLTDVKQRIEIRISTSAVLWEYDVQAALQFLENAWSDTFSDEIKVEFYRDSQRKKILSLASKIAPDKAEKWLGMITKVSDNTDAEVDITKSFSKRQIADLIVRSAIAGLQSNPQSSVSLAMSSLEQTGKISAELGPFLTGIAAINRADLAAAVYRGISDFTKERYTDDEQDIRAVIGLMLNPSGAEQDKRKLLEFSVNSTKQIIIAHTSGQAGPRLSVDELFDLYRGFALFLRPYMQRYMLSDVAVIDTLLQEFALLIPPDRLSDPLLSPLTAEKQIENARKTIGSKERDVRFMKIASWLLSRRMRSEAESLKLAGSLADEISDLRARDNLRDFIKLVLVERSFSAKDFNEAEKISLSIASPEIKSWALMALGNVQKTSIADSLSLYGEAQTALQKSPSTYYKTQLALKLASLYVQGDEVEALKLFSDSIKYSTKAEECAAKDRQDYLMFNAAIGNMSFEGADLYSGPDEISLPAALGGLAIGHWNTVTELAKQVEPLRLRLELQLTFAKSILEYLKKSKDEPSNITPKAT